MEAHIKPDLLMIWFELNGDTVQSGQSFENEKVLVFKTDGVDSKESS